MTEGPHGRTEGFGAASPAARRVPIPIAPTLAARPPARFSRPSLPGGGSLPAAARRAPRGSSQDRRDVTQPRAVMRDHPTPPAALIGRAALVLRAGFSLRPSFRGVPPRAAPSAPPRGGCGFFGGSAAWGAALLFFRGGAERENGAESVSSPSRVARCGSSPRPRSAMPKPLWGSAPPLAPGGPLPSAALRSPAVLYSRATRSPPSRPIARRGLPGVGLWGAFQLRVGMWERRCPVPQCCSVGPYDARGAVGERCGAPPAPSDPRAASVRWAKFQGFVSRAETKRWKRTNPEGALKRHHPKTAAP